MAGSRTLPSEEELLGWFDTLSNWGRWGDDDQIGTLNLIDDAKVAAAAGLVRDGRRVSLAGVMDPDGGDDLVVDEQGRVVKHSMLQRHMIYTGEGHRRLGRVRKQIGREWVGFTPHGPSTHVDGLSHMMWDDRMYNGFNARDVNVVQGAASLSVHQVEAGITTRGVLLDVAAVRGVDWLEPGDGAFPEDLEAAEERQGVRVGPGDALIVHTGNFRRIAEQGGNESSGASGYTAACLPWLRERDVAVISSDSNNDSSPSGYDSPDLTNPVHVVGIVAMGLWLVDNMQVAELTRVCAELERWEFFLTMAPWRFVGVTASPVHPLAIF